MPKRYMKKIKWVILVVLLAAGLTGGFIYVTGRSERTYRGTFVSEISRGGEHSVGYLYKTRQESQSGGVSRDSG